MRILLSRTDSIGDVVLTLPMAGLIKKFLPDVEIHFLGKTYTKPIVDCSIYVDEFINWDDLSNLPDKDIAQFLNSKSYDVCIHVFPVKRIASIVKASKISMRIATTGRMYNWLYCNKLVRFSRRRSNLHEAQLNLKLLKPIQIPTSETLSQLSKLYGFERVPKASNKITSLIRPNKFNLILHPKSKGSAVEWGLENFQALIEQLPAEKYHIFISGTSEDEAAIGNSLSLEKENLTNLLGKLDLNEFISFINLADGLVAASTGPLHIAASLGKIAIGLYSSRRPIHPGRWSPLGPKAASLVFDSECQLCASGQSCDCIKKISPQQVIAALEKY